ncbi:MAG: thermonuclease family protein [Patescibacteria group bacterium]
MQQTTTEKKFLVSRVIDGDTIELSNGKKVRYIAMDTPETVDPRKPIQCFGVEASNRNKQLVEGKTVLLEKDISETDRYGRLLRYVYIDGVFVNLFLVQEGFAYSYTYPPDVKYQSQFTEAERLAREQKRGLWGSCPIYVSTPVLIPVPLPASSLNTNCTIKGNISSSGEKIYHIRGCGSYNVTKIDEARGERWFCTEKEAVTTGWRKAKNCPK